MKRQMWFATQPLEEPANPAHLVEEIHQCGGAERIMFALRTGRITISTIRAP